MTSDPSRIKRMADKLGQAWAVTPDMTLGQVIEGVENLAWDYYFEANPTYHFSMRLANLADEPFEAGLNDWIAGKRSNVGRRKP